MGDLAGITHDLQSYKMSCSEELTRVGCDVVKTKNSLESLEKEYSLVGKLMHRAKYLKRKEFLQNLLADYEKRMGELELEMAVYNHFGLNPPPDIPNRDKIMALIEARDSKMDVVFLVEMGQM